MYKAGATTVNGSGEERHADGFLVRDSLESANQVGSFKILGSKSDGRNSFASGDWDRDWKKG